LCVLKVIYLKTIRSCRINWFCK